MLERERVVTGSVSRVLMRNCLATLLCLCVVEVSAAAAGLWSSQSMPPPGVLEPGLGLDSGGMGAWLPQAGADPSARLLIGLNLGALLGLWAYHLLLSLSLRDVLYLKYAGWILAVAAAQLSLTRFGTEFVWPPGDGWNHAALVAGVAAAALLGSLFTREYFATGRGARRADRLLAKAQRWLVAATLPSLLLPGSVGAAAVLATAVLGAWAAMVTVGFRRWQIGFPGARYFLLSWLGTALVVGGVPLHLVVGASTGWPLALVLAGSTGQLLMVSFALSDRVAAITHEKRRVRVALLKALRASEAQLDHRVKDRTAELEQAHRQLDKAMGVLQSRNRSLEKAKRATMALVAAACHELRQPAHALRMQVAAVSPRLPPALLESRLEAVRRCTAVLSDMLSVLLDLSLLRQRQYRPSMQPVHLDDLLDEVDQQFRPAAAEKNLSLDMQRCSLHVHSDPYLLRRMLFNVVSNAVKYTASGGIRVEAVHEGPMVRLCVADTGIGIPAGNLADVHRKFATLGADYAGEGLGIGLAVVYGAAKLLGHRVHLESSPALGTTATIELPFHSAAAPSVRQGGADDAAGPTARDATVAVLENDVEARQALLGLIASWGYHAVGAAHAEALLECLSTGERPAVELLVSDYHLGDGHDGLAAIAALRGVLHRPGLPALLVTGDMDDRLADRVEAVGAVGLLHKPVAPRRLRAAVESALASASVLRADQ